VSQVDNFKRPLITTGFSEVIAERLAAEHALLAARWFARLHDLLPVAANEVFPSDSLLDHIPSLIVDMSSYLKAPEDQAIAANTQVVDKARELGRLRHEQRASLHQVLREYQLLGAILMRFVEDEAMQMTPAPAPTECMAVASRLHHAVAVLLQETVETFVGLYTQTITEQSVLNQYESLAAILSDAGFSSRSVVLSVSMIDALCLGSALDLGAPSTIWQRSDEHRSALQNAVDNATLGDDRAEQAFQLHLSLIIAGLTDLLSSDLEIGNDRPLGVLRNGGRTVVVCPREKEDTRLTESADGNRDAVR